MKNTNYVLALVMSIVTVTLTLGQGNPTLNVIDLLNGEIQGNGLPKSWMTAADNSDCTIKFVNGAIHFERMSPNQKCSFAFRQNLDNGDYFLKTKFETDGNEPEISLDRKPLKEQNEIKVTDGVLNVGIQTSGAGKVWGSVSRMTLSRVSKSVRGRS